MGELGEKGHCRRRPLGYGTNVDEGLKLGMGKKELELRNHLTSDNVVPIHRQYAERH